MFKFFAEIEPCLVGMEARGSAHYWARTLMAMGFMAMGFDVKLMPPNYTRAYVKRGKNDAADAAAIEPRACRDRRCVLSRSRALLGRRR